MERCIDFATVDDFTACDFTKVPTDVAENVDLMMWDGSPSRDSEDCTDKVDVDIDEYHLSDDSCIECDFYEKRNPKDRDGHFRSETNAGGKRRGERKRKRDVTNDGNKTTAKAKRERLFDEEAEEVQGNLPFCDDYNTFCWLQYGFNSLFEKFRDEVKSPYASILDFNSDHAMFSICFAECVPLGQVTSIHTSPMFVQRRKNTIEMIEAHRGSYNLKYSVIDANELPWPDGIFDIVFASESLKDYQDPVKALMEMKRVCKPGGTLIVFESKWLDQLSSSIATLTKWKKEFLDAEISRTSLRFETKSGEFRMDIIMTGRTDARNGPKNTWAEQVSRTKISEYTKML